MLYNPHTNAALLNIPVVYRELVGVAGIWMPTLGAIFLARGMRKIHERSVLSHEIGHAVLGHGPETQLAEQVANELAANRHAAANLINPEKLYKAQKDSPFEGSWAFSCGVTLEVLKAYKAPCEEIAEKLNETFQR
jgi:Zn-dependent peptidase ImmA (M78 family)